MKIGTEIIPASAFLRSTATGELDLPRTKIILKQAADKAEEEALNVLLDFRCATSCASLSPGQLWSLVQVFEEHPSLRSRKVALLLKGDAPGTKGEIFKLCANNRGFNVQVFKDFEEALDWLAKPSKEAGN